MRRESTFEEVFEYDHLLLIVVAGGVDHGEVASIHFLDKSSTLFEEELHSLFGPLVQEVPILFGEFIQEGSSQIGQVH